MSQNSFFQEKERVSLIEKARFFIRKADKSITVESWKDRLYRFTESFMEIKNNSDTSADILYA